MPRMKRASLPTRLIPKLLLIQGQWADWRQYAIKIQFTAQPLSNSLEPSSLLRHVSTYFTRGSNPADQCRNSHDIWLWEYGSRSLCSCYLCPCYTYFLFVLLSHKWLVNSAQGSRPHQNQIPSQRVPAWSWLPQWIRIYRTAHSHLPAG